MKYNIIHSCGCTETIDLFGTNVHGERDSKAAHMESQPCINCRAAKENEISDMAVLVGSDKQISWAADIRREMVASVEALRTQLLAEPGHTDDEYGLVSGNFDKSLANLATETSAKWFIENRNLNAMSIFKIMLAK
ncbi:MAG: hypothetical protein RR547_13740 [Raoultibacter sp.]